ncbi:MAG: CYCXC family (seleno)protein [Fidelibacterota bacterium]
MTTLSSKFDCPCGHCSLPLDDCTCATADRVRMDLSSLIGSNLSEKGITDAMVRRYGRTILAGEMKVPPYYEDISGVDLPETLDPASVYPRARPAYEAAKAYPALLMQLPCFCGCEIARGSRKGHRSLLDCFTDRHGESCQTCVGEAMFARKRFEEGVEPAEIRREIIEKGRKLTG